MPIHDIGGLGMGKYFRVDAHSANTFFKKNLKNMNSKTIIVIIRIDLRR